jgi:hypothetical protein
MRKLAWIGLFVAPAAWFGQHLVGQAIAQASCSAVNASWGVSNRTWQVVLLAVSAALILAAEGAAVASFRRTEPASYEDAPPIGRVRLIAIAAMTTNLLYFVIVLLDGVTSIVDVSCRH